MDQHFGKEEAILSDVHLNKQSWLESGCVYGYLKIHHDLLSFVIPALLKLWHSSCGVKDFEQVGYKCRPGKSGTKPAIVAANQLQQYFNVDASDTVWVTKIRTFERMKAGYI